jgi:uncharacterized membrane protein
MDLLAHWMCRAASDRAIELLGAPTSLCARCTGFYLALALGLWLFRMAGRRRTGTLPIVVLASAIGVTLAQVVSESHGGIASTPGLRCVLGFAVGLPLGWIAGSRIGARPLRVVGFVAACSTGFTAIAFAIHESTLLELALALDTSLALVIGALVLHAAVSRSKEASS